LRRGDRRAAGGNPRHCRARQFGQADRRNGSGGAGTRNGGRMRGAD